MQELTNYGNRLACYLIIENAGKTLLLLRENTGFEDGNYSFISGKVEAGESLSQSVIREAAEEADILVSKEDINLVHMLHRRTENQQSNWMDFFFRTEKWEGEIQNKEPDKCGGLHWYNINSLPENMVPLYQNDLNTY
ncbi:MAG: NUDIX domain-containing protein [Bacteroidota bacterium]